MAYITVNQIIDVFRDIANRHLMINDFGNGPTYNIGAADELKFPYLWVENGDINTVFSVNGMKEKRLTFNLFLMDKINKGDDNFDEVVSDTEFILSGIIQEFSQLPFYVQNKLSLFTDINLTPVVEATDDNVNGWQATISLKIPIPYTYCEMPILPYVVPTPPESLFPIILSGSSGCVIDTITTDPNGAFELPDTNLNDSFGNSFTIPAATNIALIGQVPISTVLPSSNPCVFRIFLQDVFPIDLVSRGGCLIDTITTNPSGSFSLPRTTINDDGGNFGTAFLGNTINIVNGTVDDITTTDTGCTTNIILDPCPGTLVANFSADTTTIEPSDTVQFTDLTTDITPTSWEWDFGDGETSTLQNPTHRYKFSGQFTVTLIASDGTTTVFEQKEQYIDCSSVSAIFTIDTRRNDGLTNNNQLLYQRPAVGGTTDIDWGDGTTDTISGANTPITHTYATAGIYKVKFDSTTFGMSAQRTRDKIIEFNNWGSGVTFFQSNNFLSNTICDIYGNDTFDGTINTVANMLENHRGYISPDLFKNIPPVESGSFARFTFNSSFDIDVSKIKPSPTITFGINFFQCFENNRLFNQDLSHWFDTPMAATSLSLHRLFMGCTLFNQDISMWDVTKGTTYDSMFNGATNFNQDLSSWNTANVTTFNSTFRDAISFNSDISSWPVSTCSFMGNMFFRASSFNQNLGAWQLRVAGTNLNSIFRDSGMSTENFTDTLVGWADYVQTNSGPFNVNMTNQVGMTFDGTRPGAGTFVTAQDAFDYLVLPVASGGAGWTITF